MPVSLEQRKEIERKIDKVEELTKKKKTGEEIAKILDIKRSTVTRYKKILADQGRITLINEMSIEERRNKVEKLTKKKKTGEEIAKILGVSRNSVVRDQIYLRENGRLPEKIKSIPKRTIQKEKRIKIIEDLLLNGEELTEQQMAENLQVTRDTITKAKRTIRERNEEEFTKQWKKWNKRVITLYDSFYGQPKSLEIFKEYLVFAKDVYERGRIEEEALEPVKYATMATERYIDANFYIKLCIKFNQFEEAIKFIKKGVNYENFTLQEREEMKKLELQCQRYYRAVDMLIEGMDEEIVVEACHLSKVEKALLIKKASQMNQNNKTKNQTRKLEENKDGDEQELA